MRLAAAEPSPAGAHWRGGGCPALALLLSHEGMVPRAGVEPAALRLRVACCIQMSFHGIVVPPARICTCVLRLKRPLLSCLSFGGVVLVPLTRVARVRASPRTGFWDRRVCYSTREAYGPAGASCTRTGSYSWRPQLPAVEPAKNCRGGSLLGSRYGQVLSWRGRQDSNLHSSVPKTAAFCVKLRPRGVRHGSHRSQWMSARKPAA